MSPSESIDIMLTPKKDIMLMVVLCSATANAPQRLNSGTRYSPPTFEYPPIVLPEGHDFTIFSGEKKLSVPSDGRQRGDFARKSAGVGGFMVQESLKFPFFYCIFAKIFQHLGLTLLPSFLKLGIVQTSLASALAAPSVWPLRSLSETLIMLSSELRGNW